MSATDSRLVLGPAAALRRRRPPPPSGSRPASRGTVTVDARRRLARAPARSPCTATTTPSSSSTASSPARTSAYTVAVDGRAGLARARLALPGAGHRHPRGRSTAAPGLRLVPHLGVPRRSRATSTHGVDALRAWALRTADQVAGRRRRRPRPGPGAAARPGALPRRPGLRRRDHRRDAGVHRVAPRHRGSRRGPSCKDYEEYAHLYSPRLVRPGQPLAAVDGAERDDLRRPRHPRRLEHLAGRGAARWRPRRGGTAASSPGWRRTGSTSTSATCRPAERRAGRAVRAGAARTRATTSSTSDRSLDAFAERVDQEPQTYRWSYTREFDTQARLVVVDSRAARVARPGRPRAARRRRGGLARRAAARRRRPPAHRHVAAVPARPRAAPPRGVQRGAGRGRLGRARRPAGREAAPGRGPRALGRLPEQLPGRWPSRRWRSPRASAAGRRRRSPSCPATCTTAMSARPSRSDGGRPMQLDDPAGGLLTDPQPALAQHALRDGRAVLRRRRAGRAAGVEVGPGAGRAAHLALRRGAVVRQQPGLPRGDRAAA